MASQIYKKGRRKEYKIIENLRKECKYDILQRTAGSHSPIDIIALDADRKQIRLIQAKPTNMPLREKNKLKLKISAFDGHYEVITDVI